jgi:hypothetical protein
VFGRTAPVSVPVVILLAFKFVSVEPFQIKVPLARIFPVTSSLSVGEVLAIQIFLDI